IRTVGRFDYDERRLVAVTLKVSGYIKDLFVDYTGRPVRRGEPLFTIYSPELVSAEQEYLLAVRNQKELAKSQVPSAAQSAGSLLRASRERLCSGTLPSARSASSRRPASRASSRRSPRRRRASCSKKWSWRARACRPA